MKSLNALILRLPTDNSTARMRVWRALRAMGCGVLRDGVYVLPSAAADAEAFARVELEIRSAGGFAMTVDLKLRNDEQLAHVRRLFDRGPEYGALAQRIKGIRASLKGKRARRAQGLIERLQRSFDRLAALDFFSGPAKRQAAEAIADLKREHQQALSSGEPRASRTKARPINRAKYQNRTWATRKNPWVDRLASAWLIKRFIDPRARFVWLDRPRDRPRGAVGFDYDGAEFTHVKDRVTFEVLLERFELGTNPALASIGAAVHVLDIGGIPVPDAKGLETMLKGARREARGDDGLLAEAMRTFDLLYSAYRIGAALPDLDLKKIETARRSRVRRQG